MSDMSVSGEGQVPLPNDDRDGLRRCRDCNEWKPLDEFHVSSRRPSGRGSYCKPCYNQRSIASYAKRMKEKYDREVQPSRQVPPGHRYCSICETIKPLEDFPRNRSGYGGHGHYCKPCHNVRVKQDKEKRYGGTRQYHLQRRYGIGETEFHELLAEQGGVCAICGAEDPRHVDHDHLTGYIRGVLCFNCNGGLGHFQDDPRRIQQAIDYLQSTAVMIPLQPGVYQVLEAPPSQGRWPARGRDRRTRGLTLPGTRSGT